MLIQRHIKILAMWFPLSLNLGCTFKTSHFIMQQLCFMAKTFREQAWLKKKKKNMGRGSTKEVLTAALFGPTQKQEGKQGQAVHSQYTYFTFKSGR